MDKKIFKKTIPNKKFVVAKRSNLKNNPLLQMSGIGRSNRKNLSENVDEIYSIDLP